MVTADFWFVDQKLSKVNFNGLIMQLEQFFGKSVVFSDYSSLKALLYKFIKKFIYDKLIYTQSNTNHENRP